MGDVVHLAVAQQEQLAAVVDYMAEAMKENSEKDIAKVAAAVDRPQHIFLLF